MIYLLLAAAASGCAVGQSAFTKSAAQRLGWQGQMAFNVVKMMAALICFFVIFMGNVTLHLPTVIYAIIYAAALFCSAYFGYLALMSGDMALTSTIVSYNIIIPTAFGFIFLKEEINALKIFGFILLFISVYLLKSKSSGSKRSKIWLPCVLATFLGNGIGRIVQKLHQTAFPGAFCNEFTIYSSLFMCVAFLIAAIIKKEKTAGKSIKFAAPAGILEGANSYLLLLLSAKVNASVLFPITTVFHMLFTVMVSRILFKDRLLPLQVVGIAVGIISIILIK